MDFKIATGAVVNIDAGNKIVAVDGYLPDHVKGKELPVTKIQDGYPWVMLAPLPELQPTESAVSPEIIARVVP